MNSNIYKDELYGYKINLNKLYYSVNDNHAMFKYVSDNVKNMFPMVSRFGAVFYDRYEIVSTLEKIPLDKSYEEFYNILDIILYNIYKFNYDNIPITSDNRFVNSCKNTLKLECYNRLSSTDKLSTISISNKNNKAYIKCADISIMVSDDIIDVTLLDSDYKFYLKSDVTSLLKKYSIDKDYHKCAVYIARFEGVNDLTPLLDNTLDFIEIGDKFSDMIFSMSMDKQDSIREKIQYDKLRNSEYYT